MVRWIRRFPWVLKKERMPPILVAKYYYDHDMVNFTDYDGKMKAFVDEVDVVYNAWVTESNASRSSSSGGASTVTTDLVQLRKDKATAIMDKARVGKDQSRTTRTMKRTISM